MRLKDKVAIITGAASGFGAGIAKRFAEEGAAVAVADIDEAAGKKVAGEISSAGGKALFVRADVTREEDWKHLVDAIVSAFGRLDVVVNNAGWSYRKKPFLEVTTAEFDKIFAVNVRSVFLSALYAVPVFRKQGGGAFVNIASTGGVRPRAGLAPYNGSKGAVIVMSRAMAAEFGVDKIRVNCVNPVFSPETGLSTQFAGGEVTEEVRQRYLATIPLGRFSTPLDVANACLFLASDEAAFISGVSIEVDGARSV